VFAFQGIRPYVSSVALGELAQSQAANSVLSVAPIASRDANLAQIIRNVSYGAPNAPQAGAARGAIALISAGPDGIYFSTRDGPGSQTSAVNNIEAHPQGPYVVNEYDDIRVFGGG